MNRHRLYAMPTKPETVDGMGHQRFSRITPEYSLVYTDGEAPMGSVEMADEDAARLSKADERWLRSCNLVLIKEDLEQQMPEMVKKFTEKLDELESVLEQIRAENEAETSE